MRESTITQKGQTTIPVDVRKALDIKEGEKIEYIPYEDGFLLRKKKQYTLDDLFGCLPKPRRALSIEEMDDAIGRAVVAKYRRSLPKRQKK